MYVCSDLFVPIHRVLSPLNCPNFEISYISVQKGEKNKRDVFADSSLKADSANWALIFVFKTI